MATSASRRFAPSPGWPRPNAKRHCFASPASLPLNSSNASAAAFAKSSATPKGATRARGGRLPTDSSSRATCRTAPSNGTHVSAEAFRRLACDAAFIPHLEDESGRTLDVGRRTRTIPPAIRRALRQRQPTCAFPGCGHRRFLDAHHITHWLHGGETKLDNLVHLCRLHHRLVHEDGFTLTLDDEARPLFRTPNGRLILPTPPRPRFRGNAHPDKLDDIGHHADIPITPKVRFPEWQGDRPDYDWCVATVMR